MENFKSDEVISTKYFYSLWALSVLLIGIYISTNGLPPIFQEGLSSFNPTDIIELRTKTTVNVENFHWTKLGFYTLPQLATLLSLLYYRNMKTNYNKIRFAISFLLSILLSLVFLHKSPAAMLIFILLLGVLLFDQKVRYNKVFLVVFSGISMIFLIYIFNFQDRGIEYYRDVLLPSMFHRIIGSYSESLAITVELVEQNGYFYGQTFINPLNIFPFVPQSLPQIIHMWVMGKPGNWPAPAIGEAYLNFGWLGLILILLIINYFIFILQSFITTTFRSNKLMWSFLSAFICFTVYQIAITSIFSSILSPVFIVTLIIVILTSMKIRWK